MRQPGLFSPLKQSRFEKGSGPFITFQSTAQLNKGQLADFRKEIRNNVSQREPFAPSQEKATNIFTSWKKDKKSQLTNDNSFNKLYKSSPRKSKLPGGLNMEEILQNDILNKSSSKKHVDPNGGQFYLKNQIKVETLFKKSPNTKSQHLNNNNSYTSTLLRPQPTLGSRQSGYNNNESPQRIQLKLDRYKSWDTKLDVQLKLQNNSIGRGITPPKEQRNYHKYAQQQKDIFKDKENLFEGIRPLSTKDQFRNKFFSTTPPLTQNKYVEKVPLTDVVRMAQHFSSLSSQEVASISKGYVQELNTLQQALQRVVKQATGSFAY